MTPDIVVHRWFEEVWNQGRESTIDELLAPDGVMYGLGETDITVCGPAEFKPFWRNLRTALPDVQIQIVDLIVSGSKVSVRLILEGTHAGDGLGVPASGRKVRVQGLVSGEIEGGQIVRGWNSWDQLGLLRQIGAHETGQNDRFLDAGA